MRIEFDSYGHPQREGEIIVNTDFDDDSNFVSLKFEGKETKLITADLDQWGTYYTINGVTIAQEFDTRSFLDALIKGLTEFRKNLENTIDATIIPEEDKEEN